jgi:hypothetical protein
MQVKKILRKKKQNKKNYKNGTLSQETTPNKKSNKKMKNLTSNV